ncbi:MAG TPA: SGNH/GDSL hydrolase family protein [Silvibacterium sp.]|nr:SGNH/GDSL hydrolase family protein [Silvibacterium sp.]
MRRTNSLACALLVALILSLTAVAHDKSSSAHWVSAWSTAVHTPLPFPGLPPPPVFENQTVRMIVRPTIAGQRLRIRFSNAYGTSPLEIGSARVALVDHGGVISAASDLPVTFGGETSAKIPPGAPMLSDPIDLKVPAFAELSVSVFLPAKTTASTTHFWGQHDTYIAGPGDLTAKPELDNATITKSWYWLADVEVLTDSSASALVALGDSITDGAGAKQGDYADWPDLLARRLAEGANSPGLAVLNEGIGGNRILYDGAGVNALARLDRDVLAQPGVTSLIVLEGINDIGWPHMKLPPAANGGPPRESPFASQIVTARELILGLRQIIDRAHQHGIRVFGAALTPYEGADYFSPDGEAVRQELNQWIRTSQAFDGVIDFDAAVRDPDYPSRFREEYQSGDHLHPSAAGYKAMAAAVNIAVLRSSQR